MDRNAWNRMGARCAASMMVFGLVSLAACGGAEEGEEMAEDTAAAEAPAAAAMPEAQAIDPAQLQTGAAALAGQTVRLNAMKVVSSLGPNGFWVELPNKNPFLVVTADAATANPGETVDVVGTVTQMTPETLNEWVSSGRITENQKLEAEFATEYIDAQAVQAAAAPADPAAAPR
jgi:hypothetical protein